MTIPALRWRTMTNVVNEIRSPNQFLNRLLYSRRTTVETDEIDIHTISRGREIAPFVRLGSEGIMVPGYSSTMNKVTAPNIRLKRPLTPSPLLFGRRPGTVIYPNGNDIRQAQAAHIARDLQGMSDMITNAEEWLVSQSLQGAISYELEDQEVITITFPRSPANNVTLTTFWDAATPTDVNWHSDVHLVKRTFSDASVPAPTDCIMGSEASDAFRRLVQAGRVVGFISGSANAGSVTVGQATFASQFTDDGAIFLGTLDGVRFWEYSRTAVLPDGTVTPMIRPKYAEWVSVSPLADREMYFGAISDMDAFQGGSYVRERFSKSWTVPDPSAIMNLTTSRPLPVPRRPDATMSMKVVSG